MNRSQHVFDAFHKQVVKKCNTARAWQNVCYNQPPHPGFYLGHGMEKPPAPAIYVTKNKLK